MNLAVASIVLAGLSALLGWYSGRATERRAYRLGASTFAADWYRDLRSWASEAIDALSQAVHAARGDRNLNGGDPLALGGCCARLSGLVDRGRLYLPNYDHDKFGRHKPTAFRGLRHPALDYLVDAYNIALGGDVPSQFSSQRSALSEIQRRFVSHIQDVLDPRTHNRTVAELIAGTLADPAEKRTVLERLGQTDS